MGLRKKRVFWIILWMGFACSFLWTLGADPGDGRAGVGPNIIFILADDLGYGDLGVTGHPYARTPHIDRLAEEGLRFNQAYMSGAWCAPSRAAIMGGVYPARGFNINRELSPEKPSLTSLLKGAGYSTAHFGKWHLGGKNAPAPTPGQYGIDEALITNGNGPTWSPIERNDPHFREKTTARYIDLAIAFAGQNRDRPFFINLWLYPTHSYIDPTEEMLAVYEDLDVDINDFENPLQREFLEFVAQHGDIQKAVRAYCADITAMDTELGRLMKALKDMNLDERTVVIFTSDNGPGPIVNQDLAGRYVEHPTLLNNTGSAGPYRDRKLSLHDGGIHAPLILRWPGKIPAGMVNDSTVLGGVDFLPTLTNMAGVSIEGIMTDGVDLTAAVMGEVVQRGKPLFWNDRPGWSALRDEQWKAHLRRGQFKLFDLASDPSESNNLAAEFPQISAQYRAQLEAFEKALPKRGK
ncbi:sulfatase-like hydrolase/transferase [Puniceicoccales bacterium CK1056]|uniref:Sulfatase-like hydrolase/transferase n=1 Tax=Oceanipulchritudo coccoides TaxID=2706888 RepID=A0A6B2M1B8_9BACT|nr:sulfatase-like hydrolase/transferase [Oceanipulchritudo coccoides]NDV61575.1 sulfatase-like hydrolase/transferase [Oceanipulchritudo coccoides]